MDCCGWLEPWSKDCAISGVLPEKLSGKLGRWSEDCGGRLGSWRMAGTERVEVEGCDTDFNLVSGIFHEMMQGQ